jgi:biotin carboxylase
MNALEDKAVSRALAKKAGVPPPPGSEGIVETEQERWRRPSGLGIRS